MRAEKDPGARGEKKKKSLKGKEEKSLHVIAEAIFGNTTCSSGKIFLGVA